MCRSIEESKRLSEEPAEARRLQPGASPTREEKPRPISVPVQTAEVASATTYWIRSLKRV
jgi:hypothetical protein